MVAVWYASPRLGGNVDRAITSPHVTDAGTWPSRRQLNCAASRSPPNLALGFAVLGEHLKHFGGRYLPKKLDSKSAGKYSNDAALQTASVRQTQYRFSANTTYRLGCDKSAAIRNVSRQAWRGQLFANCYRTVNFKFNAPKVAVLGSMRHGVRPNFAPPCSSHKETNETQRGFSPEISSKMLL